jgi:hypothetical protein
MGRRVGSDYFLPQRWVNKPSKSRCAGLSCVACSEVLVAENTCKKGGCAVVRQGYLVAVVGIFLIAVLVLGCGAGGPGNNDGRSGNRGAVATKEETTAPQGARSASKTKQEPASLDVEVVSPDQAYVPAAFGEGSLWATDYATCNDTGSSASSSAGSASATAGACALPQNTLLKRLNPQTGDEVVEVPLKGFSANITEAAFGADSVWVSSTDIYPGPAGGKQPNDVVLKVDPKTNRVVDRIPVYTASGVAFGHGSVWVTSASYGLVTRIDPQTDQVVAKIEVGRGAVDIATDEGSGAVWVAGLYLPKDYEGRDNPKYSEDRKLTRIDPQTNRVVAEIPIEADSPDGGASSVAVGEGAVWAQSVDGRLFKVDPTTNKVAAMVTIGQGSSDLSVYAGAVWATFQVGFKQAGCEGASEASAYVATFEPSCTESEWRAIDQEHLARVDPGTEQVVASEGIGPVEKVGYGRLVAGGGYVWFASGGGLARVAP